PSLRMLSTIRPPAFGVAPSTSTWPLGEVTSRALMPQVPTYQVLPWTRSGAAGSFQPDLSLQRVAGGSTTEPAVGAVADACATPVGGAAGVHAASSSQAAAGSKRERVFMWRSRRNRGRGIAAG